MTTYKPIAAKLNETIGREEPEIYAMLSDLGKRIYFDTGGILSQSAEAKRRAVAHNATLGTALENGQPMHLELIHETLIGYTPREIYEYAPASGKPELREAWRNKLLVQNPTLRNRSFGLPIVTNGLTHGLSIAADLFINAGDAVIIHDKNWEGFELIFGVRTQADVSEYPFFDERGKFHVEAMKEAIMARKDKGKALVLLNFPNNPTGYMPDKQEAERIAAALKECAEAGMHLVVVVDDAYYGMVYEDNLLDESLFGYIANIHPRLLAVKIDGGTKEEYVTGLRVGFITYAVHNEQVQQALEQKTAGIICATIASSAHPSQTFVLKAMQSERHEEQVREKYAIIRRRADQVKLAIGSGQYDDAWEAYPFNSGYFMCLKLKTVNARELRAYLLDHYGIGTVSLSDVDLRIAFPCIEEQEIGKLYATIYRAIKDMENK